VGESIVSSSSIHYYRAIVETLRFSDRIRRRAKDARFSFAFVLEQTLGHITHGENLRTLLDGHEGLDISFLPVEFAADGVMARLPLLSNWTIRAGLRARRLIRRESRRRPIDAMFIHTQVAAVFTGRWMRKIPTIVSLDATPAQFDELARFYEHTQPSARVQELSRQANIRCFRRAAHLVVWADWTRIGLVRDYGVPEEKITVIAPGVQIGLWQRGDAYEHHDARPVRILFVGADLVRKGGNLLLQSVHILRTDSSTAEFEVHLVTRSPVGEQPGVIVHSALRPNSPELIALYHSSDIFCLPTLGDCLPMVLSEAAVGGMALVSTDVGAIREIVRDDDTGLLIPPDDLPALTNALQRLINDAPLRARLGKNAEAMARKDFDAKINAERIVDLLRQVAVSSSGPS
jgi:glycosyltransferase involved in cell wall biosynthesis